MAAVLCASSALQASPPPSSEISPEAVRAAIESLRQDPNLRQYKTIRSLHWIDKHKPPAPNSVAPPWIISLLRFLADSASLVVWVAGAVALATAAVWVGRLWTSKRPLPHPAITATPASSYVQNLDIDPKSLPEDIGATALTLLNAGRSRDALSLLYRGALSRLVHRFAVTVGDAFTEGEALSAVSRRLDPPRVQYFASLVAQWQSAIYAAEPPVFDQLAALCREFAPVLDGDRDRHRNRADTL